MIVMPSNNYGAVKLVQKYPGRIGWLFGPEGWKTPKDFPYTIDNGRYSVWSKGHAWDEGLFLRLCDKAMAAGIENDRWPSWVAVPDVVADADATFEEWSKWSPMLANSGFTLALVVQDGMTPSAVRRRCLSMPSVIFIGGTRQWKFRTLWQWCQEFPRIHVGRINTERDLWRCDDAGAESVDGTGWFMGGIKRLRPMLNYLHRSTQRIGPAQRQLFISETYTNGNPT